MRPSLRWQIWSCVAANALASAACNKGPGYENACRNGPPPPALDVYLGPAFHGGHVTTSGACTQVAFVGTTDRNNEDWRGQVTSTTGACAVTVMTPDGQTHEQSVANSEVCGGPSPQTLFFGVSFNE